MIAGPASDHHQAPSSTWQLHPILMLYLFSPKKKVFLVEILSTAFNISHQIVQFLISQIFHRGLTVILCFRQIFRMIPVVNMFIQIGKYKTKCSDFRASILDHCSAAVNSWRTWAAAPRSIASPCTSWLPYSTDIFRLWYFSDKSKSGNMKNNHNWMGQAHLARAKKQIKNLCFKQRSTIFHSEAPQSTFSRFYYFDVIAYHFCNLHGCK